MSSIIEGLAYPGVWNRCITHIRRYVILALEEPAVGRKELEPPDPSSPEITGGLFIMAGIFYIHGSENVIISLPPGTEARASQQQWA